MLHFGEQPVVAGSIQIFFLLELTALALLEKVFPPNSAYFFIYMKEDAAC